MRNKTLALSFLFSLIYLLASAAQYPYYAPGDMPNVQRQDARRFVSDPMNLLSPDVRDEADRRLKTLRDSTSAEVAVAIVPSLGDYTVEEYAEKLFTSWGIGKKDKDNGLLILISPGSRKARIQTGYGMEGIIPDMRAREIIDRSIIPAMKKNDLDAAVEGSVADVCEIISDPENAAEIYSSQKMTGETAEKAKEVRAMFTTVVSLTAAGCWLALLIMLIVRWSQLRKASYYNKAQAWRQALVPAAILTFFSIGTGLPLLIIFWINYRRSRNHTIHCRRCGTKMKKLNEKEDNLFLLPGQDLEERLGSIDYDVWKCPECGEVERFAFRNPHTPYTPCPQCGTMAYHKVVERITKMPTLIEGESVSEYRCEYCGHNHQERRRIPCQPDESSSAVMAALGTAAALGLRGLGNRPRGGRGGGGRGFGGGGGFGGGFGGGATGGGGASGSW